MGAVMDPESILDEIEALWAATRRGYRDGMVRCGALLHRYVLARLRAADDPALNEADRRRLGATRQRAVRDAAARLGLKPSRVNDLIHAAMGVELLSDGGDCGLLSYGAVKALRLLVERLRRKEVRRSRGDEGPPPSSREEWRVRPGLEKKGPALFRAAAAEGLPEAEVARRVRLLRRPRRRGPREDGAREGVVEAVKTADPRDVAEMVLNLIGRSRDPAAVARLVAAGLGAGVNL